MTNSTTLLSEVNEFLSSTGMGPSYFGKTAIGNSEVVKRLRDGKRIWPETADRLRAFMEEHRKAQKEAAE